MRVLLFALSLLAALPVSVVAQSGVIKGRVFNSINNEPVPFANVVIQGTTNGATTDFDGLYEITGLEPGTYNIECTVVGFAKLAKFAAAAESRDKARAKLLQAKISSRNARP